jgi:hypothetical protein
VKVKSDISVIFKIIAFSLAVGVALGIYIFVRISHVDVHLPSPSGSVVVSTDGNSYCRPPGEQPR